MRYLGKVAELADKREDLSHLLVNIGTFPVIVVGLLTSIHFVFRLSLSLFIYIHVSLFVCLLILSICFFFDVCVCLLLSHVTNCFIMPIHSKYTCTY